MIKYLTTENNRYVIRTEGKNWAIRFKKFELALAALKRVAKKQNASWEVRTERREDFV